MEHEATQRRLDVAVLGKDELAQRQLIKRNPDNASAITELVRLIAIAGQHEQRIEHLDSDGPFDLTSTSLIDERHVDIPIGELTLIPSAFFSQSESSPVKDIVVCWFRKPTVFNRVAVHKAESSCVTSPEPLSRPKLLEASSTSLRFEKVGSKITVSNGGATITKIGQGYDQSHALIL